MGDGMLSREELLKRAAVLGGAGLVAGPRAGQPAVPHSTRLTAERGRCRCSTGPATRSKHSGRST